MTDFVKGFTLTVMGILIIIGGMYLVSLTQTQNQTSVLVEENQTEVDQNQSFIVLPPELADINLLKTLFSNSFSNQFRGISWANMPVEDQSLSEHALFNAKHGTHSFKIIGNNADEAWSVYSLYEGQHYSYYTYTFFNTVYDHQVKKYGIAVYKSDGQYNVSVVFNVVPEPELVKTPDGAYKLVTKPEYISYLWEE